MRNLTLHNNPKAQWHCLVSEAEWVAGIHLDEDLESYLVFLMMRFVTDAGLSSRIMAIEYLKAHEVDGSHRSKRLRDVGDQCLLVSGFFPQTTQRRCVNKDYYDRLGRSSFLLLSENTCRGEAALYRHIAKSFLLMRHVLSTIRNHCNQSTPCQDLSHLTLPGAQH